MRLIEKKCPNCGANLEFGENDKSCKCDYCKRAFEIERENSKESSFSPENFNLNELTNPLKKIGVVLLSGYAFTFVIAIIIFLVAFGFIIFIGFNIFNDINNNSSTINSVEKKDSLYKDVSELTNKDFNDLDNKAYWNINAHDDGLNDYHLDLKVFRKKTYVLYNENENKIIVVYKAKYSKPLDDESIVYLYVPVVYENIVKNSQSLIFQLGNATVYAPEYYFNLEHSEFSYGYKDIESFENDKIEPLKDKYTITKK